MLSSLITERTHLTVEHTRVAPLVSAGVDEPSFLAAVEGPQTGRADVRGLSVHAAQLPHHIDVCRYKEVNNISVKYIIKALKYVQEHNYILVVFRQ